MTTTESASDLRHRLDPDPSELVEPRWTPRVRLVLTMSLIVLGTVAAIAIVIATHQPSVPFSNLMGPLSP